MIVITYLLVAINIILWSFVALCCIMYALKAVEVIGNAFEQLIIKLLKGIGKHG